MTYSGAPRHGVNGFLVQDTGAADHLALSLNENPFPPLPGVRTAIVESIGAVNPHPECLPDQLRRLIADRIGVSQRQVMLGAGATGVILSVLQRLTTPGDRIALATPTFDGYSIVTRITRLTPLTVPLDNHGRNDLAALADAVAHAQAVVICRPHNPTGTVDSPVALKEFLQRIPADKTVILDEAYVEFVAPQDRIDTVELVRRFPNVVVVRTFSKAYGLAGLRIGYGFGSPELAATLWPIQQPFGMDITTLAAVSASYRAEPQLRRRIGILLAEQQSLRSQLRAMGVESTDARANFVYLPGPGRQWRELFEDSGIQVRHYPDGGVRITVGTRSSTRAVIAAVQHEL